MLAIGKATGFSRDLFPGGFVPDVLLLVLRTWADFRPTPGVVLEEPITALFRVALENRYCEEGKDWFVTLEEPNINPFSGVEVSRTDLRFLPPGLKRAGRAFVIESKRLNIRSGKRTDSNASQYTGAEGMMRFVSRRYSPSHSCGGMMGYVMDGKVEKARIAVAASINKRRNDLKLRENSGYAACACTPDHPHNGETYHNREDGEFVIYHLLLRIPR